MGTSLEEIVKPKTAALLDGTRTEASMVLIVEPGDNQRLLAKLIHLMFSYQYGLSASEVGHPMDAIPLVEADPAVRCVCAIHSDEVEAAEIAALGRRGEHPVFLIVPRDRLAAQRRYCADWVNAYCCAWENAFHNAKEYRKNKRLFSMESTFHVDSSA